MIANTGGTTLKRYRELKRLHLAATISNAVFMAGV
jgi:hypothetical protein